MKMNVKKNLKAAVMMSLHVMMAHVYLLLGNVMSTGAIAQVMHVKMKLTVVMMVAMMVV